MLEDSDGKQEMVPNNLFDLDVNSDHTVELMICPAYCLLRLQFLKNCTDPMYFQHGICTASFSFFLSLIPITPQLIPVDLYTGH